MFEALSDRLSRSFDLFKGRRELTPENIDDLKQQLSDAGREGTILTYEGTKHWFAERDFETGELLRLPVKRRQLYNYQRNSRVYLKRVSVPKIWVSMSGAYPHPELVLQIWARLSPT